MVSDDRKHIRELGLRRVLKARTMKSRKLRRFTILTLNLAAQDYTEIINGQKTDVTPPPLLSKLSDEVDVRALIVSGEPLRFEKLPCHTQAVERCIKLVTEASNAVCGTAARDGLIRVRIDARNKMPSFNTKREFTV
jgi:hypothetical protein